MLGSGDSAAIVLDAGITGGPVAARMSYFDNIAAQKMGNTGINNNNRRKKNDFMIYPNPFTFSTTIEIKSEIQNLKSEIFIYDVLGQIMHKQILNSKKEMLKLDLPAGIYFCTFESKSEKGEVFKETKKLVKMK